MKKADVKTGGLYIANVSGNKTEVRIDAARTSGGWDATNVRTNKKVLIKSAQRLHGEVGKKVDEPKTKKAKPAPTETTPEPVEQPTPAPEQNATDAKPGAKKRKAKASVEPTQSERNPEQATTKKLSALDAAAQVLSSSGPLNCKELIDAMASQGLWTSPGGKTPHATLYAAILREITVKADESRFVKTERGRFAAK